MEEFKQLIPEFGLLTLSVLLFLGVILHYRLYRKSMAVFYLLILSELYTPACYYMNGAKEYVKFSTEALQLYMLMGALAFLCYTLILICTQQLHFQKRRLILSRLDMPAARPQIVLWLFGIGLTVSLALYLFYFREKLPFYQAFFSKAHIDRPDTTGSIPHWFTVSLFIHIALPSLYLYYHQKREIRGIANLVLIGTISLAMVLGGNKGLVLYWFLFLWIYLWKMRIDGRIIGAGSVTIVFATIIMSGTSKFSFAKLRSVTAYGLSRTFLTQGAMLVNRFEMVLRDYPFDDSHLSNQVFSFVYGRSGGSSPTYYLGDLLIQFGFVGGFLLHLLVFAVLALISRSLDYQHPSEYKLFLFFMVQYFLGMAAIGTSFMFRLLLIIGLALLFGLLGAQPTPLKPAGAYSSSGSTSPAQLLHQKSREKET